MKGLDPKKYFFLFVFGCLVFLAHYKFSGQAVWGDGINYWAYLPSVYYDHDLDFEDEYRHIYTPENNNSANPKLAPQIQKTSITSVGKTNNPHPPGTAIVWFPAFIAADILSSVFKLPQNGFADMYQVFCGIWSVGITIIGLLLCEKVVHQITKNRQASFVSTVLIFLASPLLFYGSYDVLNSHFASFFLANLFWYLLLVKQNNWKVSVILGVVVGLATLVRLQNSLLLIVAVVYVFWRKKMLIKYHSLILGTTFLLTISPLFFIWLNIYGIPIPAEYKNWWLQTNLLGSLFHKTNGLFSRTPILLISLLGLKSFADRSRRIAMLMFFFFFTQLIVITLHGGWSAAAYGGRMYTSSLPFFAISLSYLLIRIQKKWDNKILFYFSAFFVILNIISAMSFVLFEKEVNSGKKRGLEEHTQKRVENIIRKYINLQ
jgi:hypothetical protein